ncbi:MAG: lytic transglycosylase domain-containing protein [Bryobacteraceae bacterium]|nr:lytic transglycosylase domain-containing protein [Bryobacteraceae bacterium]
MRQNIVKRMFRKSSCLLGWMAAMAAAYPALAGEYAVLFNGFRIYADRHEQLGHVIRLHHRDAFVEVPAAQVLRIETEEPIPEPAWEVSPAPATPPAADPKELVRQAAARHGLPEAFLLSVAAAESGYRQEAVSPKGSVGIMQLMPATARELQADPRDPNQNVDAGARYLRWLLLKYLDDPYQVRKALAAYNAGPGTVDRYGGVPPYTETLRFIERVLSQQRRAHQP